MNYNLLLKFLRVLVQTKRFFWWLGSRIYFVFAQIFGKIWQFFAYIRYKLQYVLKKTGLNQAGWLFKRDFLQMALLVVAFFIALPQTKAYTRKDTYLPGQNTIAYTLTAPGEDYTLEEVTAENGNFKTPVSNWKAGAVDQEMTGGGQTAPRSADLYSVVAGGSALYRQNLIPGATFGARSSVAQYIVQPGDSLSGIAYLFDVSVATILWENNLGLRSIIRPGDILKIPPATGVMHTVKKGDTLKRLATLYGVSVQDIIKFNKFKEDGTDLMAGDKIMIPNGTKPQDRAVAKASKTTPTFSRVATPPASRQTAGASGFVWPSAARAITQYYGWKHFGLDIAGPRQSPNYAAKAGTVETAQCGWNSGYGCYIIINHGGGVKTLYGHHSQLLVTPGEYVETGQTIGLMGNTGKVRGVTGIHLHFEIIINGRKVNPLGYVR